MRYVSYKSCRENKTHILCHITFFKSRRLWGNVKKYGRPRQGIDDNVIWCMHMAYWITKATDIDSK